MSKSNFHNFHIDNVVMRYSEFAPRLFNYCLSLGMKANCIMPSRAFCSDENQGYPIILLAKHFGIFPFDHGRVGGIVAADRHGPHAHHGKDVVLVQASHVGFDADTNEFGIYRRLQTQDHKFSSNCGAICGVLDWYQAEHSYACKQISLDYINNEKVIIIDNQLLRQDREEGVFLNIDQMVSSNKIINEYSTSKAFSASNSLIKRISDNWPSTRAAIGGYLYPDLFYFKRETDIKFASGLINRNLIAAMPEIIVSKHAALSAAKVNAQFEFDRTFRSIVKEKAYRGKKVVFISGIHIDISPQEGQLFPLTKFIPWAGYIQNENGEGYTLEQQEIYTVLKEQSTVNPHKIDLTKAIHNMESEPEIHLHVDE